MEFPIQEKTYVEIPLKNQPGQPGQAVDDEGAGRPSVIEEARSKLRGIRSL